MTAPVYARSGEFVLRAVGSEGVLVPIRNKVGDLDSIYVMSPVAMRVWELIDGRNDLDRIAELIAAEYDVAPETAARDVADLLRSLEDAGLVTVAEGLTEG